MPNNYTPNGQFWLWRVRIAYSIPTKKLYEELRLKLDPNHERQQVIRELGQLARKNWNFEVTTNVGMWKAFPVGQTSTGYYLWDLWLYPYTEAVA